jgi:hypothetical protein
MDSLLMDAVKQTHELIRLRDPKEREFFQVAEEVLASLRPLFSKEPKYEKTIPRWSNRNASSCSGFPGSTTRCRGPCA